MRTEKTPAHNLIFGCYHQKCLSVSKLQKRQEQVGAGPSGAAAESRLCASRSASATSNLVCSYCTKCSSCRKLVAVKRKPRAISWLSRGPFPAESREFRCCDRTAPQTPYMHFHGQTPLSENPTPHKLWRGSSVLLLIKPEVAGLEVFS